MLSLAFPRSRIKTMDFIFVAQAVFTFLSFTFLYRYFNLRVKSDKTGATKSAPEAAGGWPIIGHLRRLSGGEPLYQKLADLADEYGPVYTLRLGVHRTVVVSGLESAKECFTTNDKVLASRPSQATGKYLSYNYAMFVLSPYGHYWREMKKIAVIKLLSSAQLELLKEVRCNEINLHVKELYDLWALNNGQQVKVDIKQRFEDLTYNYILMSIAGKRYYGKSVGEETSARRFREVVNRFFYLAGIPVVSDVIPWLEWLDLGGHIKEMKRTAKELDTLISVWLEEHRQRRKGKQVVDKDFIDVMLTTLEESGSVGDYDPDTVAKATCLTLLIAGADTTSVALTWALAFLLQNPIALSKARGELDNNVGLLREVEESDIENLPYLQAIVKETLRMHPAGPLAAPHYASEDCRINGYHIPAGSTVIFNLWKIHHDPRVWPKPEEFRPERFLTSDHRQVDVRGKHFELIPFGSGRRICPGISFSLQVLHLTLARIIHGFEIDIEKGSSVDMSVSEGVMMRKKGPLEILMAPRFPSGFYSH